MGTATRNSRGLLLWPFVATTTSPEAAPSGTRATMNCSELMMTEPSTSPKCTRGRRSSAGRRPRPVMRISPPGSAQGGSMASMCGLPLTFFAPAFRSIITILVCPNVLTHNPKVQKQLQRDQRIRSRTEIIHHDTRSFGKAFETPHRRGLQDVESTKKYKAQEQPLPHDRTRNQRHQLSRNLINYHMRGVFLAAAARFQGCCWNPRSDHNHDEQQDYGNSRGRWKV